MPQEHQLERSSAYGGVGVVQVKLEDALNQRRIEKPHRKRERRPAREKRGQNELRVGQGERALVQGQREHVEEREDAAVRRRRERYGDVGEGAEAMQRGFDDAGREKINARRFF